jgi:hypothetical protein
MPMCHAARVPAPMDQRHLFMDHHSIQCRLYIVLCTLTDLGAPGLHGRVAVSRRRRLDSPAPVDIAAVDHPAAADAGLAAVEAGVAEVVHPGPGRHPVQLGGGTGVAHPRHTAGLVTCGGICWIKSTK